MFWTIGQSATLACLLEATAPKPGNVHRGADFDDLSFVDFQVAATAIAPAMENASKLGVGKTVLEAVRATRAATGTNVNLGIVLLLAPLAAVDRRVPLAEGIGDVLNSLTAADCDATYEAIRLAAPGGLGQAAEMDVAGDSPRDLLAAMQSAASRDLVARQYANGFADVLGDIGPAILAARGEGLSLTAAIIRTFLRSLAVRPDTLIARKAGIETAEKAATFAAAVLAAGTPEDENENESYLAALDDFDFWLRSDGRRRNPGATADLIAASLFALLRDNRLAPPFA